MNIAKIGDGTNQANRQGRVVTANALIEGFRAADPDLCAKVIG